MVAGAILIRRLAPLAMLFCWLPWVAQAIDPGLCADDGVTEVPPFASGRDANQCLMVDPGNGGPPVPFQYEHFHKTGVAPTCKKTRKETTVIDHKMKAHGRCRTRDAGEYCSLIFWDVTFDNYLDPACKNADVLTYGDGAALEYLWFKDSRIVNGWKCAGGEGWKGPNGIGCAPGERSKAHCDNLQIRGQPSNGGWFVLQDSVLANGHVHLFLHQQQSKYGANGSTLWQGVQFGQFETPVGAARNWVSDCRARGSGDKTCLRNRARIGFNSDEIWLVDVWGSTRFRMKGDYNKVVVVNTGCGPAGCNGERGFENGWPHPLQGVSSGGPGTCPDGLIPAGCAGGSNTGNCYCYTSLEKALADTRTESSGLGDCPDCPHERPPFLQFSAAGWEQPPSGRARSAAGPAGARRPAHGAGASRVALE